MASRLRILGALLGKLILDPIKLVLVEKVLPFFVINEVPLTICLPIIVLFPVIRIKIIIFDLILV